MNKRIAKSQMTVIELGGDVNSPNFTLTMALLVDLLRCLQRTDYLQKSLNDLEELVPHLRLKNFLVENGYTLAKGNRSKAVTKACKDNGGFYLGSIGGPAAILAKNCIKKVEVLDNEEDGMEAVWKIEVKDFPAFIVVDDKGDDFFKEWLG